MLLHRRGLMIAATQAPASAGGGGGGGFTPASLPGLNLWIEADPTSLYTNAGTTLVSADGQAVQQVNDKSGTGRNLSQLTLGNRPLYKTDLSKPSLLFDGVDDWLDTGSDQSWTDGTGQHWFGISLRYTGHAANQQPISIAGGSGNVLLLIRFTDTTHNTYTYDTVPNATAAPGGTIADGTAAVIIGTITSSAGETFVDNVSGGSTALTGTRKSAAATMFLGSNAGTNPTGGRVFGMVHGTGTLSSSDRASLQTYLAGLHP